ncbi:MAG: hypothetical protein GC136_00060 [Alphaproteobacteria bacterium]|nr:hypothetical protein [Alphaproteobacteria bacterium]
MQRSHDPEQHQAWLAQQKKKLLANETLRTAFTRASANFPPDIQSKFPAYEDVVDIAQGSAANVEWLTSLVKTGWLFATKLTEAQEAIAVFMKKRNRLAYNDIKAYRDYNMLADAVYTEAYSDETKRERIARLQKQVYDNGEAINIGTGKKYKAVLLRSADAGFALEQGVLWCSRYTTAPNFFYSFAVYGGVIDLLDAQDRPMYGLALGNAHFNDRANEKITLDVILNDDPDLLPVLEPHIVRALALPGGNLKINDIPSKFHTASMLEAAVQRSADDAKARLRAAAKKQDVQDDTPSHDIHYIDEDLRDEGMYCDALEKNVIKLMHVPQDRRTAKIYKAAVVHELEVIKDMPEEFFDLELCEILVNEWGRAGLQAVPDELLSPALFWDAVIFWRYNYEKLGNREMFPPIPHEYADTLAHAAGIFIEEDGSMQLYKPMTKENFLAALQENESEAPPPLKPEGP